MVPLDIARINDEGDVEQETDDEQIDKRYCNVIIKGKKYTYE